MYSDKTTSEQYRYNLLLIHILLQTYDYGTIYHSVFKPAFVFDGWLILDHEKLQAIGFQVQTVGKRLHNTLNGYQWSKH